MLFIYENHGTQGVVKIKPSGRGGYIISFIILLFLALFSYYNSHVVKTNEEALVFPELHLRIKKSKYFHPSDFLKKGFYPLFHHL